MRSASDPEVWSQTQFSGAKLSDKRRILRTVRIATAMAKQPGKSLPQLFEHPYDLKAAYNFFKHPETTPDNLQSSHREHVRRYLSEKGTFLLLEDTSALSWTAEVPIDGLGPVTESHVKTQGFLLHSVLAVKWFDPTPDPRYGRRPDLQILGLANQQYHVRIPVPLNEPASKTGPRYKRSRESDLWRHATQKLGEAPRTSDTRWVRVCDRGADIYEFLVDCLKQGHGFAVRAAQDRAVVDPQGQVIGHLFDLARQAPALGGFTLQLRSRPRHPAREARLWVSAMPVTLRSPRRPGFALGKQPPITCQVVRVWEDALEGAEPLEWILLTDLQVERFGQAFTCALQYATRWVIEEFHKGLKTGLGAERLQLETADRLFSAIAIMSVVALRLLDLRERMRATPDAPANESGLSPFELEVLAMRLKRKLKTIKDVAMAIGRLGGHLNRKGDGMPGWQTLWLGMKELQALVVGAALGLQLSRFG